MFEPSLFSAPASDSPAGYVGMLTANSFMKREFGKKLIEEFFPSVDLTHVIDTSGAYIPGHGTPTCILLGRNQPPAKDTVRTIGGIKGEPRVPADPAQGLVWQSILDAMYGTDRATDLFDQIPDWSKNHHAGDLLGDLYQQRCEGARKGRALVQTPPFIRSLLLRETLGRSLQTFGPAGTWFCDPSCGTGHLLVDAFRVFYRAISDDEQDVRAAAQEALDRTVGADLDPVCVAIASYRLVQAAWDETGWPGTTYQVSIYCGDSLTHHRPRQGDELDDEMVEAMEPGRYTAVAANPPYIVAPDRKTGQMYRDRYVSAHGKYSLACPFTELCWGLAKPAGVELPPVVGDRVLRYPTAAELEGVAK
jgi:hypothetical protein